MMNSNTQVSSTLTTEDYAIVGRNVRRGIRVSDHHDSIDYGAMLARRWQIQNVIDSARKQDYDAEIIEMALDYGRLELAQEVSS